MAEEDGLPEPKIHKEAPVECQTPKCPVCGSWLIAISGVHGPTWLCKCKKQGQGLSRLSGNR